jgi:hypothetical protein
MFWRLARQQLGRSPTKRADLCAVVLVRDFPRPVIELELLELREDAVTLLGRRECGIRRDRRRRRLVRTEEGDRHEHDRRRREKRAEEKLRAHARASDSRPP